MKTPQRNLLSDLCSEDGFRRFYDLYINIVYSYVVRRTGDPEVAKDITACIFIILYDNCHRIGNIAHLEGFLYRTADNLMLRYKRDERRRAENDAELMYVLGEAYSIMDHPEHATHRILGLRKSFLKLSVQKRRIIVFYYFRKMSVRGIAARLGITPQTVWNHLSQARRFLRDDLLGGGGEKNPSIS